MKTILRMGLAWGTGALITSCGPYGPMHRWNDAGDYGCWFGYGHGGMLMGIIALIVLIVALYVIVQALKTKKAGGPAGETPLDILKKRYAKGEITKEEFDRIKQDL